MRNSVQFEKLNYLSYYTAQVFFLQRKRSKVDDKLMSVAVERGAASPDSIAAIKAQWDREMGVYLTTAQWKTIFKTTLSVFLFFFFFLELSEEGILDDV